MTIAAISILAITGLVWLLNRILPFKICPTCAGVSGTWLWMLAARFLGFGIDPLVLAILMAGSVVGIAYQIEKRLTPNQSTLLWKTLFITVGFVAVYTLILSWWAMSVVIVFLLVILTLKFTRRFYLQKPENKKVVEELENKMENCC